MHYVIFASPKRSRKFRVSKKHLKKSANKLREKYFRGTFPNFGKKNFGERIFGKNIFGASKYPICKEFKKIKNIKKIKEIQKNNKKTPK